MAKRLKTAIAILTELDKSVPDLAEAWYTLLEAYQAAEGDADADEDDDEDEDEPKSKKGKGKAAPAKGKKGKVTTRGKKR